MTSIFQKLESDENRKIDTTDYQKNLNAFSPIYPLKSSIKFIEKFGGLTYVNEKTNIQYVFFKDYPYSHDKILNFINLNNILVAPIGLLISEIWGNFTIAMNEKEEIYIVEYNKKFLKVYQNFFMLYFLINNISNLKLTKQQ